LLLCPNWRWYGFRATLHDIADLLFEQVPRQNLLSNGSGRLVQESNYYSYLGEGTGYLGRAVELDNEKLNAPSFKPIGGWTYLMKDGVGIHITQDADALPISVNLHDAPEGDFGEDEGNFLTHNTPDVNSIQWSSYDDEFTIGDTALDVSDSLYDWYLTGDGSDGNIYSLIDGQSYTIRITIDYMQSWYDHGLAESNLQLIEKYSLANGDPAHGTISIRNSKSSYDTHYNNTFSISGDGNQEDGLVSGVPGSYTSPLVYDFTYNWNDECFCKSDGICGGETFPTDDSTS